jgi:hypothetical protein
VNGELASLIALCLHGNAWLGGVDATPPHLETENSTFKYVRSVQVEAPSGRLVRKTSRLVGVSAWLEQLRSSGSDRLWLVVPQASSSPTCSLDPQLAAAFANGGEWAVMSTGRDKVLWTSTWTVGDRGAAEHRIWDVRCTGTRLAGVAHPQQPDIEPSRDELLGALRRVRHFADSNSLSSWTAWFDKAIAAADADDPVIAYNPDLAPAGMLDLARTRLLAAAVQAWVFGGMGSWNDVWLDDETQNRKLTEVTRRLCRAVLQALTAVTNASYALAQRKPCTHGHAAGRSDGVQLCRWTCTAFPQPDRRYFLAERLASYRR